MKKICITLSIVCVSLSIFTYRTSNENHRLNMLNTLNGMENRILREEIADLEKLPSYEQAKRDTLISMGSPSSPGAYKDGWDNAVSLFANESYETGYHTAIAQFSYQQTPHNKYLVPEPKNKEVASK